MTRERDDGRPGVRPRLTVRGGRRLALASLATAVSVFVATAHAQEESLGETADPVNGAAQDPGPACAEATAEAIEDAPGCDTEYTPIAKDGSALGWAQVAGDVHPDGEPLVGDYDPSSSPTPVEVDFYAVDFANEFAGFAAGARCAEDAPEGTNGEALDTYLRDCTRVPVIYRYRLAASGLPVWEEVYRGQTTGYVGAIAWLSHGRALAVGGDGCYPRREDRSLCPPGNLPASDATDPIAGTGRAWLATDARNTGFEEVAVPDGMTGMTAVDSTFGLAERRVSDECRGGSECAFAGALRQIWVWKDGRFDPDAYEPEDDLHPNTTADAPSTPENESDPVENGADWLFRVRAIRFAPDPALGAVAVTSGCCASGPTGGSDPTRDNARLLRFDPAGQKWWVKQFLAGGPPQTQSLADSLYALTFSKGGGIPTQPSVSILAAPGGPQRAGEPGGHIVGPTNPWAASSTPTFWALGEALYFSIGGQASPDPSNLPRELVEASLRSARFVAGDGDLGSHQPNLSNEGLGSSPHNPDMRMDWAVGGRRDTRQAVAYTTTARSYGLDPPDALDCPDNAQPFDLSPECQPDAEAAEQTRSGTLFVLPSYRLNGFTMVGNSGAGWAAGDRGALLSLGGDGGSLGAPPENVPQLGARRRGPAPDRGPYEGLGPELSGEPGAVPSLSSRHPQSSGSPRLTSYGSPNPEPERSERVSAMAMSRDGSEGWAVGPATTLYRFEGSRWTRCRTHAVAGLLDADPACAALKPLREFNVSGVEITAIARIPLEYDSDPTNDDEFEAIAAAAPAAKVTGSSSNWTFLRYRQGEWGIDLATMKQFEAGEMKVGGPIKDIAYTAPDDGWMIGGGRRLFHFDGTNWVACTASEGSAHPSNPPSEDREACDDPGADRDPGAVGDQGLFPASDLVTESGMHLTSAGDRVYLYGTRRTNPLNVSAGTTYPVILLKDPGPCESEGDPGCWRAALDPKYAPPQSRRPEGILRSMAVSLGPDGTYTGWGVGEFDGPPSAGGVNAKLKHGADETALLRSGPDGASWSAVPSDGAAADYLLSAEVTKQGVLGTSATFRVTTLPATEGTGAAVISSGSGPLIRFDPADASWKVLETPYGWSGGVMTATPDNAGGLWLATQASFTGTSFHRYTDRVPTPVFDDSPHPIREQVTAAAMGSDGSLWVATGSAAVYRYDRITGWDRISVPGWDPGRVVTRTSPAHAIAVGPDGGGVVVGKSGRIANIDPRGAVLDRVPGTTLCSETEELREGVEPVAPDQVAPCGTGRDLRAAAVGPDGSALVGGDFLSLLWRPAGGEFRAVSPPPAFGTITGLSMPAPGRAWLVTDTGRVFAGSLEGSGWSWEREALDEFGDPLARDESGTVRPLRAVSVDSSGHGYAVGDSGVILERHGDGWRRVDAGYLDDLTSVALGPHGRGALVGGDNGLILTLESGRFQPARVADAHDPLNGHRLQGAAEIVGLGLAPGYEAGEVEAWAASAVPTGRKGAILHFSSDAADPLLDGGGNHGDPLPDAPPVSAGELGFAAFGRSECQYQTQPRQPVPDHEPCPELIGSNEANDVVARRIRDEILAGGGEGPDFALFTGDVGDIAGTRGNNIQNTGLDQSRIHNRWEELVARPLLHDGMPLFGAVGGRDLSSTEACDAAFRRNCASSQATQTGPNLAWREAMAGMPGPWGGGEASSRSGLEFVPVGSEEPAVEPGDQSIDDPTDEVPATDDPTDTHPVDLPNEAIPDEAIADVPDESIPDQFGDDEEVGDVGGQEYVGDETLHTGGARTHYAFDVLRGGEPALRVAVVDTSLRSLAASDAQQNPAQEQLRWLREVLASTPQGARKVVVSNTPTYSYGPGAGTDTQADATVFEQALIEADVDLVVSGRLGWNGVYWALAPGLHYPCPGAEHPDPGSPPAGVPACDLGSASPDASAAELVPGSEGLAAEGLPFVVASSAGGKFGPDGNDDGSAAEGYWRGYTEVRLEPGSDRPPTILQRPVFDWIGLSADTHALSPRQRTRLRGFGREPAGIDVPLRYVEIDSPAITHRYDLLLADPEQPWLPCTESDPGCAKLRANLTAAAGEGEGETEPEGSDCAPYLCLPERVGTVDRTTGELRAGDGRYPETFALAMLSVDERVATYPVAFERSPSFVVKSALRSPATPLPLASGAGSAPPPPDQPPLPRIPQIEVPAIPAPPSIPPLAAATPPEPTPPAPPAPPPPAEQPSPLDLTVSPAGLTVATPAAVIQPPTPPVNPAPPSGARREARQRQAAAQKSGADAEEGAGGTDGQAADLADSPPSAHGTSSATRLDAVARSRQRPEPSFTVLRAADGGSSAGALYGGAVALTALALALGLATLRPTPRRRPPEVPAPAWAEGRERIR